MDQYILQFDIKTIKTYTLNTTEECHDILKINKTNFNFKILNINIRSIKKNLEEFLIVLGNLQSDIDCIVLTETRTVLDVSLFNIPGYNILYNESTFNQNDGVIVFLKDSYSFNYEIEHLHKNMKAIIIKINVTKSISAIVTAVYRSPDSDVNEFIDNLHTLLERVNKNIADIKIFTGDINIDLLKTSDMATSQYLNNLHEFGYVSTINEPTREQGESKSCIDHIFLKTNEYERVLPTVPTKNECHRSLYYTITNSLAHTQRKHN